MSTSRKVICIPLLGKGATNHLHRQALVDEFNRKNIDVLFLVREDYVSILKQLTGCRYQSYNIPSVSGWLGKFVETLRHFRRLYHPSDPWVRIYHNTRVMIMPRLIGRLWAQFIYNLARLRWIMNLTIHLEGALYRWIGACDDLDSLQVDILLVMSIGSAAQPYDIRLTWWAYRRGKPVVHLVGNYDGLSSNGFRGFPIRRLLVWGDQMYDDAVNRHGIPAANIRRIGALRYNMMPERRALSRDGFLRSIGFDPSVKTVVFGGSNYEYHYFEILPVFELLKERSGLPLQLIIRVYPNTRFLDSPYLQVLMKHLSSMKDVWVSVGDPNFQNRKQGVDVIEIDEAELWQLLNAADVVVNLYSTLALEACIFNKPVVHMWYFLSQPRCLVQPVYFPTNHSLHNVRAVKSAAVTVAQNREELVQQILEALRDPGRLKDRRQDYVKHECGELDGCAVGRLVDSCLEELAETISRP